MVYAFSRNRRRARVEWLLSRRSMDQVVRGTELLPRATSRRPTISNQTGGIKMRDRVVWFLVGIVLVFVLALMGTGYVVASMHGGLRAHNMVYAHKKPPLERHHFVPDKMARVP